MARFTYIPNRVIDSDGISDGASIYFYATGTTTPITIYSDSGLTTPIANPVVVAAGATVPAVYYAEAAIRVRVVDSGGSVVSDDDPYDSTFVDGVDLAGTGGAALVGTDKGTVQEVIDTHAGLPHFERLISRIDSAENDVSIVVLSDSTGDETSEWIYLLANGSLKATYPEWTVRIRFWNSTVYDAPTTLQTGTNGKTIDIYAGAVSGATANYFAAEKFTAGVSAPNPDVVILSYGHNGDITGAGPYSLQPKRQLAFFNGIADKLARHLPEVPVVMIGQNPSIYDNGVTSGVNDGFMETRLSYLRPFAARRGWGFINVHDAFLQSATALSGLLADSLHPNATGSQLWADTVWDAMRGPIASNRPGSEQEPALLRAWTNFSDFSEWTASNVTLSKQTGTGRYETEGQAATATITSTAAAGWLTIQALTADDEVALRGKLVTFAVWQRIPTTSAANAGRIEVVDSGGTTTSSGAIKGTDFVLFTVTHRVDAAAAGVTLYIYPADGAASPASVVDIDRASLSFGTDPIDPIRPQDAAGRRLKIMGSGSAGIGVLRNSSTAAAGLRFVPNEDSSAATAWTSDFKPDGFAVKETANTNPRYEMVPVGGYRMGSGSAATDMGIDRQTSGVMRFSGADLYPDADGTRYLGANGAHWRAVFLNDGVYVDNTLVVQGQGAAVADASGGATVDAEARTAINTLLARLRAHGLIAT